MDAAFEAFRRTFDVDARPEDLFGTFPFRLAAAVGREAENRRSDVARIETFLAKAGYHDVKRTGGPTGYFGLPLENAVQRFQKDRGLAADGLINPDGPTLLALKGAVGEAEGAPARPEGETREANAGALLQLILRGARALGGPGGRGVPAAPRIPPVPPLVPPVPPRGDPEPPEEAEAPSRPADPRPADNAARREALADEFVKQVTGPMFSDRGDPYTQKGNNIVAQECKKVLAKDYPDLAGQIKHAGGATEDGEDKTRLKEKYVPRKEGEGDKRIGSSNPDLTWQRLDRDPRGDDAFAHANTATTGKRGNFSADERKSYARLVKNVGEDFANILPKLRPGMNEQEYRETARNACRSIFRKWLGEPADKSGDE